LPTWRRRSRGIRIVALESTHEGGERISPDALGVQRVEHLPAHLHRREALRQGVPGEGALVQRGTVGNDSLKQCLHASEGFVRHLTELGSELEVRDDAQEDESIERRMGKRSTAERLQSRLHEVRGRVVGEWHGVNGGVDLFEEPRRQRFEEALLGPEDAVDGSGRGADLVGDRPDRRCVGPAGIDEPLGGGEEGRPGGVIVLLRPSHA
jgi:hypothetical protein